MTALGNYLSRRGEFLVLLLVVLLSVTLMLLSSARKDVMARSLNDAALTPVQIAVSRIGALRTSRAELDSLRSELARERLENAALAESGREAARLRRMLAFREELGWELVAARVIAREATPPGSGYKIDRGTRHGMREGLAVVTPRGLVGKVVMVEPRSAWVRPLISRACRVSTRLERTRVDGILDWSPDRGLHLTFVPLRAEAAVGDVVVTSGLGGTFPRGIRVGRVSAAEPNPADGTLRLLVEPSVDFAALEEVFVVREAPQQELASELEEERASPAVPRRSVPARSATAPGAAAPPRTTPTPQRSAPAQSRSTPAPERSAPATEREPGAHADTAAADTEGD